MKPWIQLDTANVPGGSTQLRLMQRDTEFSIMLGTNELMNSRLSGSEQALADLAHERIGLRPNPKILIGGLGMGFTLRAALASASPGTQIVVAEIVHAVISWARGPLAPVFGNCLDDPRVEIVTGDVGRLIAATTLGFDAILLDVDNGPEGVSRDGNDGLYGAKGLKAARNALRPGGILSVWSSGPNTAFTRRLGQFGFTAEEIPVRARAGGRGARHLIWIATKSA